MPRNLRKRGEVWWFRITKNGAAHEGSLQTANLGLAKERLERIRQELTATRFGEKPRRTFDEAAGVSPSGLECPSCAWQART